MRLWVYLDLLFSLAFSNMPLKGGVGAGTPPHHCQVRVGTSVPFSASAEIWAVLWEFWLPIRPPLVHAWQGGTEGPHYCLLTPWGRGNDLITPGQW